MKKRTFPWLVGLISLSFLSACSSVQEFPRYDQVLVYDKAYDYTFLRTLEALNTFPDWTVEETDKEKGLIVLRNVEYGHMFDRDKWVARFHVKRLDRKKTSVELEPESQQIEQAGELLRRIDQVMKMVSAAKGEERAQLLS